MTFHIMKETSHHYIYPHKSTVYKQKPLKLFAAQLFALVINSMALLQYTESYYENVDKDYSLMACPLPKACYTKTGHIRLYQLITKIMMMMITRTLFFFFFDRNNVHHWNVRNSAFLTKTKEITFIFPLHLSQSPSLEPSGFGQIHYRCSFHQYTNFKFGWSFDGSIRMNAIFPLICN